MLRKSSHLYIFILAVWLGLLGITFLPLLFEIQRSDDYGWGIASLVTLSTIFIAYFWLNGTKDLVYTLYYYLNKRRLLQVPKPGLWDRTQSADRPFVVMVYCTYNDFSPDSLLVSMQQDYENYAVVILDDSTDATYRDTVDAFAKKYNIYVMRRSDNAGFKAGNLNNFLQRARYDFFVILDSDEIIPRNFIRRSLDYFAYHPTAGIVQANHVATRNVNKFMNLFSIGVNSHWLTYQAAKNYHGFLSLLGHGAMVKRECYEASGGFPHLVAEDLCFSIEARNVGYFTVFAPDIICEEEYPVNYLAFKKRHSKWTQGNMEFIKKYTGRIIRSHMHWYEKLDIVLFTYNLPLTALFSFYVVINVILLPLLNYDLAYPIWLLLPTVLFLIAPMLNDFIFYAGKISVWRLVWYLMHSMLLYGSMFFISLKSSLKSLFNASIFHVTPKNHYHISWREAIKANRGELGFAFTLCGISILCTRSPLPILLISIPAISSVYLTLISNQHVETIQQPEP